jgi:putative CocE/NonD family hydrolase
VPPGPIDLKTIKDRVDVLCFDSEPLAQPVEVTGRASVELYVSTDAPDTNFMVALVDVYPDGYEWQIRESAFMLRYRDGFENPQPAKSGEVYKLTFQLPSTALVVNKRPPHRPARFQQRLAGLRNPPQHVGRHRLL